MNLSQLHYFLAIIEAGGFARAADQLSISQPSLSAGIKKLEQELGVALFERRGRRAVLTLAGQSFAQRARKILQEYQSALSDVREFQDMPILRLGVLCTLLFASIASLVSQFRIQYPQVTIELHDSHTDDLSNWLEAGKVDLAVTVLGRNENPRTSLELFHQRLLLAVPVSHPFANRRTVALTDLDGQHYIERVNCEFWREYPQIYEAAGVEPQVVYSADHEEWAVSLIQAGLGISIMPEWNNLEGIAYVQIAELDLRRTVGLKWRGQSNLTLIEQFRAFANLVSPYLP